MKLSVKNISLMALAAVAFVSCSKDQQAVNKLDGEWSLTSKKVAGAEMIDTTAGDYPTYYFEACTLKDRNCNGFMKSTNAGTGNEEVRSFTYMVHDDAANLHFYWTPALGAAASEAHCAITTQEKDVVTFTYTNANGDSVEETIKRGKALEEN